MIVRVTHEKFVEIWQTSQCLDEVVKKTGLTRQQIYNRTGHLRKNGIPIKKLCSGRTPLDVKGLTKIAKKFAPKDSKK